MVTSSQLPNRETLASDYLATTVVCTSDNTRLCSSGGSRRKGNVLGLFVPDREGKV